MLSFIRTSAIGCAVAVLSACGGGGGGGVASIPPAPVAPTPPAPPPPTTPPPVPSGAIGLQSPGPFKTYSAQLDSVGAVTSTADAVQFAYSASDNKYTISLPAFQPGQLVTTGASGSFNDGGWTNISNTVNDVTAGSGSATQAVRVLLAWPGSSNLKYTSTATWVNPAVDGWKYLGTFAYGIPTAPGDVPTTGSASYSGSISGLIDSYLSVWGSVSLNFDFGAGTLSGEMKPAYAPIWDEVPLGTYTFRDTVFSRGSTSFSGAFQVNGTPVPSSFQGSFNGPQAAELMAGWTAQVMLPGATDPRTMAGVWTAKRP